MNRDPLNEALDQISDRHLSEAMEPKKPRRMFWLGAVAALLALVIGLSPLMPKPGYTLETTPPQTAPELVQVDISGALPGSVELAGLLAQPEYPEMQAYPESGYDYDTYELWEKSQRQQYDQPRGYSTGLINFWTESLPLLLDTDSGNAVCSPVNIYMALAMLAECTDGNSRQQILDLLHADSIRSLREQAGHVWNAHYCYDGVTTSILGSSLWMDEGFRYDSGTVKTLAENYYASVFQGDLGSAAMNESLQGWLNDQTGGLLKDQIQNIQMPAETALALATTIFYRASWDGGFSESRSTTETFHAPTGDISWAFMHKTISQGTYYPGDGFGAVALQLQDGSKMWLVLPDEGETPQSLLDSGKALAMILKAAYRDPVSIKINLSMPRFDICAETDLSPILKELGITDVFSETDADFTAIMPDAKGPNDGSYLGGEYQVYLGKADHAARVSVDEEGVAAAAYTVMLMYATGMPMLPDEEMDFILDRPFLFVITSHDGLPTFAGVVNQP